jgi:hypothetical protein
LRHVAELGFEVCEAGLASCGEGDEVIVPSAVLDVPEIGTADVADVDWRYLAEEYRREER